MKFVYITKSWSPCECETPCNCQSPDIDLVFLSEEKAKARAKELYRGFYDKEQVIE